MSSYERVVYSHRGGPSVIRLVHEQLVDPRPGYVRVRVAAAGVAYADLMMSQGLYPGAPRFPFTPGYDIVGVIDARGPDVRNVDVGQPVAALTVFGGYSEYVYLPSHQVLTLPEGLDAVKVVCLVLNYITAYQMLHRMAFVKKSASLLVTGAAGGVGTAVLQLGKLAGLKMIGMASESKHEIVAKWGATPVDYQQDLDSVVRRVAPEGLDIILESIGIDHSNQVVDLLKPSGKLIVYGLKNLLAEKRGIGHWIRNGWHLAKLKIKARTKRITYYSIVKSVKNHPDWFRDDFYSLINLLQTGKIDPIVAREFRLHEAEAAQTLLLQRKTSGKIVLIPKDSAAFLAEQPLPKL